MISVVIPLYNKEAIVEQSLQSVLSQDFADFEVVVVNDGSTDHSVDVVKKINDPRLRLLEQENGGPSKARNTGARAAKGEWIVFLDADDELLPGALTLFHSLQTAHQEADIIDCASTFRENGKCTVGYHPIEGMVKNPMREFYFYRSSPGQGHSMFRRSKVLECPYNETLRRFEDGEWLMRLLPLCKVYSSQSPTFCMNISFCEASKPRKNIEEDFTD